MKEDFTGDMFRREMNECVSRKRTENEDNGRKETEKGRKRKEKKKAGDEKNDE